MAFVSCWNMAAQNSLEKRFGPTAVELHVSSHRATLVNSTLKSIFETVGFLKKYFLPPTPNPLVIFSFFSSNGGLFLFIVYSFSWYLFLNCEGGKSHPREQVSQELQLILWPSWFLHSLKSCFTALAPHTRFVYWFFNLNFSQDI